MTTQAVSICLHGGPKGQKFTATATDDAWTECTDANGLSAYQAIKGSTITGYSGSYTGGCGVFRIYNTVSGQVKCIGALNIITEEEAQLLTRPVSITENDIVQVHCVAAPT
jgi:hypothetical protein